MSAGEGANSKKNYSYMPVDAALLNGKKRCADPGARCALMHVPAPHVHAALARQVGPPTSALPAVAVLTASCPANFAGCPSFPSRQGQAGSCFQSASRKSWSRERN